MTSDLERLARALATMPEAERAVFALARNDGLSHRQIAEALDVDLEEVECRLASAMLHLVRGMAAGP